MEDYPRTLQELASCGHQTSVTAGTLFAGYVHIEVRDELARYLGGLSDHGAKCFHEHLAGDQSQLPNVLSARIGRVTSDENGHTKRYKPSERDRTRRHRETNKVFWWHVKLQRHVDRIYFLYEPPSVGAPLPEYGRIVVGLFKDHCILPN